MNYGYGKTFHLKDGFTALNGCVQYYKVKFDNAVVLKAAKPRDEKKPTLAEVKAIMEAQGNYLRALETLRTYGGQPIITKVAEHEIEFTLEQANVYGLGIHDGGEEQVSKKWKEGEDFHFQAEAKDKIEALFGNVKTVAYDYAEGFDGTELADGLDLSKALEDKEGEDFALAAENAVEIKEVLF